MASLNTSTGPGDSFASGPIEQLLVMHCLKEDSVLGREGFSVRAVSAGASDRATLDWAMRLESYELPLDMKSGMLLANQAPRRLALIPGPAGQGQMALVHTAYLPEDTVGRSHSFVSQVLLLPRVSTLAAVMSWGSPDWHVDEYPRGESRSLPTLDDIPQGSLLGESILSAFLSRTAAPADQSLARSVYPGRIESNPEARRRWVRAALHGFLLTAESHAGLPRTRVCILAEPGAVALLVYAIARLLPPQLVGTVTFSTYEPPHTSLRENKVARVIGSYSRNGFDRTDSDGLRRKGYVVDTFRDAYGPDLSIEPSWPLEGLLNLAAEGDWTAVDELRELWSRAPQLAHAASPASLAAAIRIRPLAVALRAGTIGTDGLLDLRRNPFGEGLLRDPALRRAAWESVKRDWLRPGVRSDFADLLREHVDELLDEVRGIAQTGPAGSWREGWEALKPLVEADRRAGEYASIVELSGKNPAAAAPPGERVAILREWAQLAPKDAPLPNRLHWLLRTADASEFVALARSGAEPRHVGLGACLALAGVAGWHPGPALLKDLNDDQFQAMLVELAGSPHREAALDSLRSSAETVGALVKRLFQGRAKVPQAQAEELLAGIRCDEVLGQEFWLEGKHLEGLLDALPSDSLLSRRVWAGLIARITPDNFASSSLTTEMEALIAAREKFRSSLAAEDRDRLDAWNALRTPFTRPSKEATAPGTAARLRQACETVGQTRESLTREWFDRRVLRTTNDLERKRRNETLGRVLLALYEKEDDAWYAARKLAAASADDEQRRIIEADLQTVILSDESLARLVGKTDGLGRTPGTFASPRGASGRRKKSLNQWKPYAAAFLAGCAFTMVFMLLLWPVISAAYQRMTLKGWSKDGERIDPKEQSRKRLQDRIAEREAQIEERGRQLADREKTVDRRETAAEQREASLAQREQTIKTLEQKPLAATDSGGQDAKPPDRPPDAGNASDGVDVKSLRDFVLESPLKAEGFQVAREKAKQLTSRTLEPSQSEYVSAVHLLLKGLHVHDVMIDSVIAARAEPKGLDHKSDFCFLAAGEESRFLLATVRPAAPNRSKAVSFYFLQADPGLKTNRGVLSVRECDLLGSTVSGKSFLLRKADPVAGSFAYLSWVNSTSFYLDNKNKPERALPALNGPRLTFSDDRPGTKMAISEDGKMVAWSEPVSARSEKYLNVAAQEFDASMERRSSARRSGTFADGNGPATAEPKKDTEQNSIEFDPKALELDTGVGVSSMSFDSEGRTLVVGIERKPYLVALGVNRDRSSHKTIRYNTEVRDWALSVDGKLAVVTDKQIYVDELLTLRNGTKPPRGPLGTVHGAPPLKCVAFGPRGTVVATGDERGTVSIRWLRKPLGSTELIRLAHVGPILKVGFSPDGRVLAALASTSDPSEEPQVGVIRLWLADSWEPAEDDRWTSEPK